MSVTSNRDTAEWLTMFDDVLLAQSAVDRFKDAAYDFVIEGERIARGSSRRSKRRALCRSAGNETEGPSARAAPRLISPRSDGSVMLTTTAHERDAYLYLTVDEQTMLEARFPLLRALLLDEGSFPDSDLQ